MRPLAYLKCFTCVAPLALSALSALSALIAWTACTKATEASVVTVFAAQSLENGLRAAAAIYEKESGTKVELHVAGSQVLVAQLSEGAHADVVATADESTMAKLTDKKLVASPHVLVKNKLVLAVPAASTITSLEQALVSGTRLVMANEKVPVGNYARKALQAIGKLDVAMPLVVSNEENVAGVVTKLTLGEADAGFVYATDVAASGGKLRSVRLPPSPALDVTVPIAVLSDPAHSGAAEPFLTFIMGAGRTSLLEAGFLAP